MIRRFVCAAFVTCVTLGIAMADEFNATVTKVEGDKVTFHKTKFDKEAKKAVKDGDSMTLTVAKDAKIAKGKAIKGEKGKFEIGDNIADGLKNEIFTKISEKGVITRITTSSDNKSVTQLLVLGGGGKKKKDGK